MRRVLQPCLIAALIAAIFHIAHSEEKPIPLFNGADLSGWTAMGTAGAFEVKNNAIYSNGKIPYPSWLRSDKQYENFILRFEYKTEGWYEGGVFIHAPELGPLSKLGFKLHLRHDQKAYAMRSPGAIYDAAAPLAIANLPSGQWNQCEIECNWPALKVRLNNTLIHDIDMSKENAFKHRLQKGYVGIQNLGCGAYFRNINIQLLPDRETWTELFEGSLDDFHLVSKTKWELKDKILTGKRHDGFAYTKQSFSSPFEFQVWAKTQVNGNGGLHFHWNDDNHGIEIQCFNAPDSTNPTGSLYNIASAQSIESKDEEWFLIQLFTKKSKAVVFVNGELVCETDNLPPPYEGPVGFQQHTEGAVIHYKNARIKPADWFD